MYTTPRYPLVDEILLLHEEIGEALEEFLFDLSAVARQSDELLDKIVGAESQVGFAKL